MTDLYIREEKHRLIFNEFEIKVLERACRVLKKTLGEISKAQALDILCFFYNAPHADRDDPERALERLRLSAGGISTFCRYEFELHRNVPGFTEAVVEIVMGRQDAGDGYSPSIVKDLEGILWTAKGGAKR